MEKQCFKCLVTKPLDFFYKHKQMADGHLNKCKECNKKDVSNNYRENIDHYKKYEKLRMNLEHRVKARKEYSKTEKMKNYKKEYGKTDKAKNYKKEYAKTEEGKIQKRKATVKYRMNHPIQSAANTIVGNAIRDGKLIRLSNCSKCNVECVPDGHHCDYAYPLDVIWLCRQCHNDWHKVNKPLNGDK